MGHGSEKSERTIGGLIARVIANGRVTCESREQAEAVKASMANPDAFEVKVEGGEARVEWTDRRLR